MKVHKYETLYPRIFWIVNYSENFPTMLTNKFIFYENTPGWDVVNKGIEDELRNAYSTAIAGCYAVEEKSTGRFGLLMVIFRIDDMDTSIIAHESVHVADYYYEVCGCNSEDFSEGNEAYAYLVGWVAGCVANVLIKERDGLK